MPRTLYVVDAFTDVPFAGNPAAVVLLRHDDPLAADTADAYLTRLAIAGETNLSETAFVTLPDPAVRDATFDLRWYTPMREVDLCGHATLAASHALYDAGHVSLHQPLTYRTRSGVLRAAPDADWRGFWLDFPSTSPREAAVPADVLAALGSPPFLFAGRSSPPDGADDGSDNDYYDWFLELPGPDAVKAVCPSFDRLRDVMLADPTGRARGVVVTSRDDPELEGCDVVSRCFFPAYGIDEDPVTGSAHCTIGPYFARELGRADGQVLHCRQASRRGGSLRVTLRGGRVHLGGRAVTVVRGKMVA